MIAFKIKDKLEHVWYRRVGYPVVQVGSAMASKRALLVYLSIEMKWKPNDSRFGWHQNYSQSREIARLLAERGYRVDVVQYNDKHFIPSAPYDLMIAHPGPVADRLQNLPKTGFRLCLRSGRHSAFVDRAVAERYVFLRKRRGAKLKWSGTGETNDLYRHYDAVACFDGNGTTAETFAESGLPVYSFRNYANPYLIPAAVFSRKAGRFGFVYMASHLHVSKGLDWLIEAFAERPDLHLYICGTVPRELKTVYAAELKRPNIHCAGFVHLNSAVFRRICRRAAWYISPSATDSCQGAALDAMAFGLIPVLSEACGIDTCGAGFSLKPCTPETMLAALARAAGTSPQEIERQSTLARETVEQHYRPRHFLEDWNCILDRIEASSPLKNGTAGK